MVLTARFMFQDYHTLIPGINSFLEAVLVPLNTILCYHIVVSRLPPSTECNSYTTKYDIEIRPGLYRKGADYETSGNYDF